jgi:hypothetical protein
MNRKEFIARYFEISRLLKIDTKNLVVGAGGSLLLLGIRKETRDLDLGVPHFIYKELSKMVKPKPTGIGTYCIPVFPDTDIHILDKSIQTTVIEGVTTYTAEEVLKQKLIMNREKDQEDIRQLRKLLGTTHALAEEALKKSSVSKVREEDVVLVPVAGTPDRGNGPGGEKWRIDVRGIRAGVVFINVIDEPPIGRHASIQIYLNIQSQGKGIGRIGYLKACEMSQHSTVYAHMRKSNIASRKAAEAAGFVNASPPGYSQLILVRHMDLS